MPLLAKWYSLKMSFRTRSLRLKVFLFIGLMFPLSSGATYISPYCSLRSEISESTEKDLRLVVKDEMRQETNGEDLRKVKIFTNRKRIAGQQGGPDEKPDPAAPFIISEAEGKLYGLPAGVYLFSSGKTFYYAKNLKDFHRGGPSGKKAYELVVSYVMADGREVEQAGGYAAANSSRGWDARLELEPLSDGSYRLVVTQGAMELPAKLEGGNVNEIGRAHV